eukprot:Nk52_evm23s2612 gene=Nk52_evmTU23s2612
MTSELAERLQLDSAEGIEEYEVGGEEEGEDNEEQYLLGDEYEVDAQNQEGQQDDEEQYPSIYQNKEGQNDGTVTEEHEQNSDSTSKSKGQLNEELQRSVGKTPRWHMKKSTKNIGRRMSMSEHRKNSGYITRVRHAPASQLTPLKALAKKVPMSTWETKSKDPQGVFSLSMEAFRCLVSGRFGLQFCPLHSKVMLEKEYGSVNGIVFFKAHCAECEKLKDKGGRPCKDATSNPGGTTDQDNNDLFPRFESDLNGPAVWIINPPSGWFKGQRARPNAIILSACLFGKRRYKQCVQPY